MVREDLHHRIFDGGRQIRIGTSAELREGCGAAKTTQQNRADESHLMRCNCVITYFAVDREKAMAEGGRCLS